MTARRWERAALGVAVAAGLLMAWGAFAMLPYIRDEDIPMFWFRLAIGIASAAVTVWAAAREHWLAFGLLALVCCITPVAAGWAWVQFLYIALALWALAKVFQSLVSGRYN